MVDYNTAFPSKYIKAAELQKRAHTLTIESVGFEKVGQDQRLVIYFVGKQKGLPINKTNGDAIAYIYGNETNNWHNKLIEIYPTLGQNPAGQTVEVIRVRMPADQTPSAPAARTTAPANVDFDDDIPF